MEHGSKHLYKTIRLCWECPDCTHDHFHSHFSIYDHCNYVDHLTGLITIELSTNEVFVLVKNDSSFSISLVSIFKRKKLAIFNFGNCIFIRLLKGLINSYTNSSDSGKGKYYIRNCRVLNRLWSTKNSECYVIGLYSIPAFSSPRPSTLALLPVAARM